MATNFLITVLTGLKSTIKISMRGKKKMMSFLIAVYTTPLPNSLTWLVRWCWLSFYNNMVLTTVLAGTQLAGSEEGEPKENLDDFFKRLFCIVYCKHMSQVYNFSIKSFNRCLTCVSRIPPEKKTTTTFNSILISTKFLKLSLDSLCC